MNKTQPLQSSLRNELTLKDLELKEIYSKFTSQQQESAIPNNIFFEWVGNKNIAERSCHIVHHFNSLARFNKFSVTVLVDNPYRFLKTESQLEGVTGQIKLITVDQLNKDFLTALKESEVPESDKLYRDFIQTTQLHGVGLSNQALRSDYYRLALVFTYGGIHSDVAPAMQEFDKSASSLHYPLIPLKSQNGLLISVFEDGSGPELPKMLFPTNNIIASGKHNPIIIPMLKHMLQMENHLKTCDLNTSKENYGFEKSLYDVMRLPQCERQYTERVILESNINNVNIDFIARPDLNEATRKRILDSVKSQHESEKGQLFSLLKKQGRASVRFIAVAKLLCGGLKALPVVHFMADKREGFEEFIRQSTFPLPQGKPTFGNLKNRVLIDDIDKVGLGSWHGYSNPKSVDDIGIRI